MCKCECLLVYGPIMDEVEPIWATGCLNDRSFGKDASPLTTIVQSYESERWVAVLCLTLTTITDHRNSMFVRGCCRFVRASSTWRRSERCASMWSGKHHDAAQLPVNKQVIWRLRKRLAAADRWLGWTDAHAESSREENHHPKRVA